MARNNGWDTQLGLSPEELEDMPLNILFKIVNGDGRPRGPRTQPVRDVKAYRLVLDDNGPLHTMVRFESKREAPTRRRVRVDDIRAYRSLSLGEGHPKLVAEHIEWQRECQWRGYRFVNFSVFLVDRGEVDLVRTLRSDFPLPSVAPAAAPPPPPAPAALPPPPQLLMLQSAAQVSQISLLLDATRPIIENMGLPATSEVSPQQKPKDDTYEQYAAEDGLYDDLDDDMF